MPQLPVILTAFANSYDTTYLSQLGQELNSLQKTLAPLSYLRHVPLSGARTRHLVDTLNQYKEELLIFHFGGHADGEELMFEDKAGNVNGLADLLSLHPQLKLVFLNGCNTQSQAIQYIDVGIPAVIATTFSIEDGKARLFAEVFYEALVNGHTIQEAFIRAKGTVKLDANNVPTNEILPIVRGLRLRKKAITEAPWRLYAQDNVLNFRLTDLQNLPKTKHAKKGLVLYKIPKTMQLQHETKCIVRIAIDEEILIQGIQRDADTIIEPNIGVSNRMEAKLIDPSLTPAFSIRSTSEPIQLINDDRVTEWKFYVTPLIVGQHELELKVIIIKKMGSESVRHETTFDEKIVIEAEGVSDEEIGFVATDVSIMASSMIEPKNQIEIKGDGNITLQDVKDSDLIIPKRNTLLQPPVIITAFANSTDYAYLDHLVQEQDRLQQILMPLSLQHVNLPSAKSGQLEQTLTQYQKELLILHFGVHDDGRLLRLEDSGEHVVSSAKNLALYPQLKLVFLNGCSTQAQVKPYLDAGVPAVIASTRAVTDGQAMQFAEAFYNALATGHNLEESFGMANIVIMLKSHSYENEVVNLRGLHLREGQISEVPWGLYVARDEMLRWKLTDALIG